MIKSHGKGLTAAGKVYGVYRIGTALEVVSDPDDHTHQIPGLRHWTEDVLSSPDVRADERDGPTACGVPTVGMILTPGYPEKLTCPDCVAAYVARQLKRSPD